MPDGGPRTVPYTSFVTAARGRMARKSRKSLKSPRKCRVAVDWNTLTDVEKFNRVLAIFKSVTAGGADGSVRGVNGSINAASANLILDLLRVKGNVVGDLGAADGKFMVCAFFAGVKRVIGVEFAKNREYKIVLNAVVEKLMQEYGIESNLEWIGSDIEDVRRFCSLSLLFCDSTVLTQPRVPAVNTSSRKPIFRFHLLEWHGAKNPEPHPGAMREDFIFAQSCCVP
jgi:hypothetical protein